MKARSPFLRSLWDVALFKLASIARVAGEGPAVKVEQYFTVYETYHRHPQNKLCHYVGIPLIVYAVLNLLYQIPHLALGEWQVDFALLVAVAVIGFYVSLSLKLALAMTLSIVPLYLLAVYTPWQAGLAAFVVGWV